MEAAAAAVAPTGSDWRSQIDVRAREVMIKQIMKTLKKHLPMQDQEGLDRMAVGYERKFFNTAPSKASYLRKLAMLSLEVENPNRNPRNQAPGLPPQGNNPAQSSGFPLMSQQKTRQGSTSTYVNAASLPSPDQTVKNFSQTSALQNMSGQFSIPQMQLMTMQSCTQSGIQQNPSDIVQQHVLPLCQQPPQCVEGQQQNPQLSTHQQSSMQRSRLTQPPSIPSQQQLMDPQPNLRHDQSTSLVNSSVEMQQQQRLHVQSNDLLDHLNNSHILMPRVNIENLDNIEFTSHNPLASLGFSGNEVILSDEVRDALGIEDPSSPFYNGQGHWSNDLPIPTPSSTEEDGWFVSQDPNCISTDDRATYLKKRKLDVPSSSAPDDPAFAHVDDFFSPQ